MNEGILQYILGLVTQVIDLSSTIYVYDDNGIRVSVLSFFVALSILSIVLFALLNFVRTAPYSETVKGSVRSIKRRRSRSDE